jgi:threonine dehydrogenase-like Zn-dependent dehydrogenase
MKALTFQYNIPKYLLTGLLDRRWPRVLFTPLAPVQMRDVPEPELPGDEWVRIRPRLSGLCGSDMSIITCHESLTLQPFASYPFVLGHEVCGEIVETGAAAREFQPGERVTVMPMLGCAARGIAEPCRFCASGRPQLCENFTEGALAPGTIVGATAGVPGFISEMGVAHISQLHKVPDGVSDEAACLTDPFSNGLHMAMQNRADAGETLMVVGCGAMGLTCIAALKAVQPEVRVLAVEIDPFHSELALSLGAEVVIKPPMDKRFYRQVADLTGAKMFTPLLAKPLLIGGVDRVFDTVGSTETIETSLRVLANAGWFNLLGIGEPKKIDWTPVWLKELTLRGVYGYQVEEHALTGALEHDYELALRLHAEGKLDLSGLVTHEFKLDEWRKALEVAMHKGKYRAVKIAFRV